MSESILLRLIVMYATLSLASVGGAPSIIPDLHRQVVEVFGWMSDRQFAETFVLAQLAPGPNMMVTSLIGWRVAGLAGLLVSTVAIILPASTLAFGVAGSMSGSARPHGFRPLRPGFRRLSLA